jgi:hypothetical protein
VDAFGVLDEVVGDYEAFAKCLFDIQEDGTGERVAKEIVNGLPWQRPGVAFSPAFEAGSTVSELIDPDLQHSIARDTFRARASEDGPAPAPLRVSRWPTSCQSLTASTFANTCREAY